MKLCCIKSDLFSLRKPFSLLTPFGLLIRPRWSIFNDLWALPFGLLLASTGARQARANENHPGQGQRICSWSYCEGESTQGDVNCTRNFLRLAALFCA